MEEKEIKFDIVILSNPMIKYSPLSFGTAFTNIHYLLDEKVLKSQKNLEEYFKIYGPEAFLFINYYENVTIIFRIKII